MELKALRLSAGLTQAELGRISGVNSRQIQRIENGESKMENVTLGNAARLASALGVKIERLLEDETDDR